MDSSPNAVVSSTSAKSTSRETNHDAPGSDASPGKLEAQSGRDNRHASRKSSAPLPNEHVPAYGRGAALDRWQTTSGLDALQRAESIPSRAWIHWNGGLVDHEHESDVSSIDEILVTTDEEEQRDQVVRPTAAAPNKGIVRRILMKNKHCKSTGRARGDGRLQITVHETAHTGYIANVLGAVAHSMRPKRAQAVSPKSIPPPPQVRPRLTIVIMVVGSRGDIQPFLRIGKYLKEEHGHHIRIASHPVFRDLVEKDTGLEFFSVGGDPAELMAFMVKNPGMVPTLESVKAGEIGKRRAAMAEMFDGFWRACIHANEDDKTDVKPGALRGKDVFIADGIIANPPSFAHIHCAEALGIPVHLVFTFPYTPTHDFPHPLASIKQTNVDQGYANFISYPLVEMMTWQGLGDLVNKFRVRSLGLDPVSTLWAPCATYRMHVPFAYLWSPGLVPKPEDWGEEIDVSGFVFLDLASSFKPPQALVDFLDAGEVPIYIGFGSIVVDDAKEFTEMIFEAIEKAGVRALVSRGWGGFGRDDAPDNVFMLDNTPHDWLFPRVKGCVHHGGAGTTAIGLKCGLPTMIVPFFGDQYFWGSMVEKSGAGPEPIPYKRLTADNLADGIKYLLTDEAKKAAGEIARSIEKDGDGAKNTVTSIQKHMRMYGPPSFSCAIFAKQVAVWQVRGTHIKLGIIAAHVLVTSGQLSWKKLRLLRHTEWLDFEGPGEPVTAVVESLKNTLRDFFGGIGSAPYRIGKTTKRRISHKLRSCRAKRDKNEVNGTAKGRSGDDDDDHDNDEGDSHENPSSSEKGRLQRQTSVVPGLAQYGRDISNTLGQSALAVVKAPAALFLALGQGFHNAPRLYGDDTVRRPTRISGMRSGLVASRRQFVYGLYDGVSGVVRLPARGVKNEGFTGLLKGTGMGVAGLVLKPISAVLGPIGCSMQGVVKQVERRHSPQRFVRHARMVQGENEFGAMAEETAKSTREQVSSGWEVLQRLMKAIAEDESRRGLAGQMDKLTLDIAFMFVNVERAQTVLYDLTSGKNLEEIVTDYKEWNIKATDPNYSRGDGSRSG